MAVRDLQDGATITVTALVREAELRRKRDGTEYLRLVLGDRTGTLCLFFEPGLVEGIALRRLGRPEDIANGVRFFVSSRASWVTGQVLSIDGGRSLF